MTTHRRIFFDTETTGRPSFAAGHRIVQIAAVELLPDNTLGRTFETLVNPGREIPEDVIKVHGITNERVATAPRFKDVIGPFLEFIKGAELFAHNADFDEGFISAEMQAINYPRNLWQDIIRITDTLALSRRIAPKDKDGKTNKHSLDALLDRYGINREEREYHSALLDSKLLAQAFVKMTEGVDLTLPSLEEDVPRSPIVRMATPPSLLAVPVLPEHEARHAAYLATLAKDSPQIVPWEMDRSPRLAR